MSIERRLIIQPEIRDIGLRGIYLSVENIQNKDTDPDFDAYKQRIFSQLYEEASQISDLKEDTILYGFRLLHEAVGAPNRKNLAAPETLCKILVKNKSLHPINLLVDIYNLISLRYKLALGAHDWDNVEGDAHLRLTDGSETFQGLGEAEPKPVEKGFYSYIDDSNEVICYLDVKQCEKTKVTTDSNRIFIVVQGNTNTPLSYIEKAAEELSELIRKYCGGQVWVIGKI